MLRVLGVRRPDFKKDCRSSGRSPATANCWLLWTAYDLRAWVIELVFGGLGAVQFSRRIAAAPPMPVLMRITPATAVVWVWPCEWRPRHSHRRRHAPRPFALSRHGASLHPGRRGRRRRGMVVIASCWRDTVAEPQTCNEPVAMSVGQHHDCRLNGRLSATWLR